jgi:type IV secretory pathway TrbD component
MSAAGPSRHPVYRALYLPLTMMGIERSLFWGGLAGSLLAYEVTFRMWVAPLVVAAVWGFGRWSIARDPHMLTLVMRSKQNRSRYDPAKWEPTTEIEVR